jgi:hypothetical protein
MVAQGKPEQAEWNSTFIVRGDVTAEARKLKEQAGGDLVIWGQRASQRA